MTTTGPDTSFLDQIVSAPTVAVPTPRIGTDESAIPRPAYDPSGSVEPTDDDTPSLATPSGLLQAFIQLRLAVSGLSSEVAEHRQANQLLLQHLEKYSPVKHRVANGIIAVGRASPLADWIDLGGPTEGFYWNTESVSIGGTDIAVSATVTAVGLYVVTSVPNALYNQSPGMSSVVDQGTTLPKTGFYGNRDIVLAHGDHLVVGLFGATASQEYRANAVYTVYNVAAARGRTVNVAGN